MSDDEIYDDVFNLQMRKKGREYIKDHFHLFHSRNQQYFKVNGYDKPLHDSEVSKELRRLEYSLGVFEAAAEERLPHSSKDEMPYIMLGDEVTQSAYQLLERDNKFYTIDFIPPAINALITYEAYNAFHSLLLDGAKIENRWSKESKVRIFFHGLSYILFPVSLGFGLSDAFSGKSMYAALWFLVSTTSLHHLYLRNNKNSQYLDAYKNWEVLYNEDFPVFYTGTGYGLKVKFENMVQKGIRVPSILIDLCVLLQEQNMLILNENNKN